MQINELVVGTKLELFLYDHNGKETKSSYISQLEDILDEHYILIAAPIFEGQIVTVPVDTIFKLVFYHEKGVFYFKGKVVQRGKKDNIIVLKIEIISKFTKIQRREYFRINWVMPVKVRLLQSDDECEHKEQEKDFVEVLTKDMSGGGLGIITSTRYTLNSIVEVEVQLDEERKIRTRGKVVRSYLAEGDNTKYDTGILFEGINNKDRDAIIKFIFEKQVLLKRKGLI